MSNSPSVLSSLYALLYKIIDYAGLFPPANLPLEEAIRNYIEYRTTPQQWMLSRFILPATKIEELSRLIDQGLSWDGELTFSALGRGGVDRASFLAGVEADVRAISDFSARYAGRVQVDVYETRLPVSELEEVAQARNFLGAAIPCLRGAGLTPFFEAPFGHRWEAWMAILVQALGHFLADTRVGFKLRTGGVTADAFPTPQQIALALITCRDYKVPLKCTAGLHHPVRSFREEVETKMHGFLNVFVAGVLATVQDLTEDGVVKILEDEEPASFEFAEGFLMWYGNIASVDQVEAIREKGLLSFGCCSFEEPIQDLLGLGLIKS